MADDYNSLIQEAQDFLKLANEADTMNRQNALEDLKFGGGDQWPVELQNSRNLESRPVITVNKVDNYCRQVSNQQRQQRPRIKVHATNTHDDMIDAQVIQGIIRHIEVNSNAVGLWRSESCQTCDAYRQPPNDDHTQARLECTYQPNHVLPRFPQRSSWHI